MNHFFLTENTYVILFNIKRKHSYDTSAEICIFCSNIITLFQKNNKHIVMYNIAEYAILINNYYLLFIAIK